MNWRTALGPFLPNTSWRQHPMKPPILPLNLEVLENLCSCGTCRPVEWAAEKCVNVIIEKCIKYSNHFHCSPIFSLLFLIPLRKINTLQHTGIYIINIKKSISIYQECTFIFKNILQYVDEQPILIIVSYYLKSTNVQAIFIRSHIYNFFLSIRQDYKSNFSILIYILSIKTWMDLIWLYNHLHNLNVLWFAPKREIFGSVSCRLAFLGFELWSLDIFCIKS